MELILSLAIGTLAACGVWLLLRPRTFQVIMGLLLLSYAVNFGDGSTADGTITNPYDPVVLNHTYDTAGVYSAHVIVSNGD